jgi:hypothetical protein
MGAALGLCSAAQVMLSEMIIRALIYMFYAFSRAVFMGYM